MNLLDRRPAFTEDIDFQGLSELIDQTAVPAGRVFRVSQSRTKPIPSEEELQRIRELLKEYGIDRESVERAIDMRYQSLLNRRDDLAKAIEGKDILNFDPASMNQLLRVVGATTPDMQPLKEVNPFLKQLSEIDAQLGNRLLDDIKGRMEVFEATKDLFPQARAFSINVSQGQPKTTPEVEANQLAKNLNPQDKATFFTVLKAIKNRIGSFDPNDNTPIPGTNLSTIDRFNPLSKKYDEAQKTYSDLSRLYQTYLRAISGQAVTESEARRIMRTMGIDITNMSPSVIRNFIQNLVKEVVQDIEFKMSGVSPEAVQIYKSRNKFGGKPITKEMFLEFLEDIDENKKPQLKIYEAGKKEDSKKKSLEKFK